jgi:hypothetical protein
MSSVDDTIPENIDLHWVAQQLVALRREVAEIHTMLNQSSDQHMRGITAELLRRFKERDT